MKDIEQFWQHESRHISLGGYGYNYPCYLDLKEGK